MSTVVVFVLIGSKSREDFLIERAKLNQEVHDWTNIACELELFIEDSEIFEINGNDGFTVKRLKKAFLETPTFLW